MNKIVFLLFWLTTISVAQDFSKQWRYVESLHEKNLNDELVEIWEYYLQNPINLNDSNELYQLHELQLLNETDLKLIKAYCRSRQLISIYELQGLDINIESLKRVKDFIYITAKNNTKTTSKKSNLYLGLQCQTPQKTGILSREYIGSPFKTHFRYRSNLKKGWSLGLNWEKDPGEPLWYENEGANNFTINFSYKQKDKLRKILFGKYDINIGEGLLFGTSYRINKPYFLSYKPTAITKESLSSKEYNYFKGIATQWKIRSTDIDVFISHRKLNGKASIDKTGLFRTSKEIGKRKRIQENLVGIAISKKKRENKISWAGIVYRSDYLNDKNNFFQSLYLSKNYYNIDYSGEIALQNLYKWALIQKLTISISNNSLITLQFRSRNDSIFNEYKSDYSSFSNGYENGFLWCFQHNFNKKWQFRATFDHFRANYLKNEKTHFSYGRKIYSEISRITDKRKFVLQFQNKILSDSEELNKFKLYYLEHLTSNVKFTAKGNYIDESGQSNTSLQSNFYRTSNSELDKINISYCVFNTQSESIFWQAPYFYGNYNSRFLHGKGITGSISYQRKFNRATKLGIQLTQLSYTDRKVIGTGNEQIGSNSKLELSLYIKWKN